MYQGNNILIAKFMGGLTKDESHSFISMYIEEDDINFDSLYYPEVPHDGSCWKFKDLKYNKSWNWLIPVVEKIECITLNKTQSFRVRIDRNWCYIDICKYGEYGWSDFLGLKGDSKIEVTYLVVVKFIKWYNERYK